MTTQEPIATDGALIVADKATVALAYESDESIQALIRKIETDLRAEVMTADTKEGRDRIKSQAYKIARSKTTMDEIGKGLTEEARGLIDKVNARRKIVTSRLDALKDEIRAPLTAWEKAEDERIAKHKARIASEFGSTVLPTGSAALMAMRSRAESVAIDESWEEFTVEAAQAKADFLRFIGPKIESALALEEQAAELARLREAEAKRKADEARAAAEQAARDAEAKALREAAEAKAREEQREKDAKIAALEAQLAKVEADRIAEEKSKADERRAQEQADQDLMLAANMERIAAENAAIVDVIRSAVEALPSPVELADEPMLPTFEVPATINHRVRDISGAVLTILRQCFTHEAGADEVANALLRGEIPHVQVI